MTTPPLRPVNNTSIEHRGRDRRTDLAALRERFRPGSVEWTEEKLRALSPAELEKARHTKDARIAELKGKLS